MTKSRNGKVVHVSAAEYEKGLRRGEQIESMRALYGRRRRRHFYDLGIANIERLNVFFNARSAEYWRGYADGLRSESSHIGG